MQEDKRTCWGRDEGIGVEDEHANKKATDHSCCLCTCVCMHTSKAFSSYCCLSFSLCSLSVLYFFMVLICLSSLFVTFLFLLSPSCSITPQDCPVSYLPLASLKQILKNAERNQHTCKTDKYTFVAQTKCWHW